MCGTGRADLDGVADYAQRLARALLARGVDVVLAAGGSPIDDAVQLTRRWDVAGVALAARRLRDELLDVVHVQYAPSAFGWSAAVGLLPSMLGRDRLVTTVHEYGWWDGLPPALRPLGPVVWPLAARAGWDREAGRLTTAADALISTNALHADALRARLGRTATVIPIGPNVEPADGDRATVRAALRRELGTAPDAEVAAFFGFVHPVKGIRDLVDAAALLAARRRGFRLLLVGGFESLALPAVEAHAWRAEVVGRIAAAGLAGVVHLTGHVPEAEASRLLTAADVGVLPLTAGTTAKSGALLCCAVHSLPVVATAAEPPDPALDGVVLPVPRRAPEALAAAVARVLDSPGLAADLASAGRAWAAPRSWDAIADAHLDVYDRALGSPGATRSG